MKKILKKYLLASIPFILSLVLALVFSIMLDSSTSSEENYFRNPDNLNYLIDMTPVIGLIITLVLISVLLIDDSVEFVSKVFARRRNNKNRR